MTTDVHPDTAAARAALRQGDFAMVHRVAASIVAGAPDAAEGHFLLGVAAAELGQVRAGIDHIVRAVALDAQGEYRAQLAKLYCLVRRDGDAADVLRDAEGALPSDALSLDTMGCVYARLGDHRAALPHFERAVTLAPDDCQFRYNHAVTLNFLGDTAAAESALEALIALAPDNARAHHLLANLRKQRKDHHHVTRLRTALDRASPGRNRLLIGYALAKELEDLEEEALALDTLRTVNAEHRRTLDYIFQRDAANFDAMEAAWPSLSAGNASGASEEAPIFIIGMPRTGTTLVDRILSSHPEVESAGELQTMPLAVKQIAATSGREVLDPETVARASIRDVGEIGQAYLRRAAAHRSGKKPRFTDKFPGNFLYAGFIATALPQARIVCLRRHPMDTVLSNFRNLFAVSSRYYDYSYDLLDIAAYYVRFDRLMAFWRERLGDRLLEIPYEDLVADQTQGTARLLAHCGLPWHDDCLAFHRNSAPVSTPSAAQVRRPIYTDSVARWKRHAEALEPVRQFLVDNGIAVD